MTIIVERVYFRYRIGDRYVYGWSVHYKPEDAAVFATQFPDFERLSEMEFLQQMEQLECDED